MSTATALLLETARRGELHHAIILHGPSAPPLRDIAIRVAKSLNCLDGTSGDQCQSCVRIDRGVHPDIHILAVADGKKMISIDQVRAAVDAATMRPYEGRTKVFIIVIDPADALSIGASNALLKTLEEPSRDTTFVMVTRSPDILLPTILSRSQTIYVGASAPAGSGTLRSLQQSRLEQIAMFESAEERDELVGLIIDRLHRFATKGEAAALLGIASLVGGSDHGKDALALLSSILCDAAALDPSQTADPARFAAIRDGIPREALLAAADAALGATKWFTVNADVRLLAEQAVAPLVKKIL